MLLNCEETFKIIISYLSIEHTALEINLSKYLVYIGKNNNVLNIQPKELNSKYVELSKVSHPLFILLFLIKTSNFSCKNDCIDYNYIVDEVSHINKMIYFIDH